MSYVSPYSNIVWVTAAISITACVQQMVFGDTLGLPQEKAPSRGMRNLVNITKKNMLPKETYHHLLVSINFETRTCRENKAPHTPIYCIYISGSGVGA